MLEYQGEGQYYTLGQEQADLILSVKKAQEEDPKVQKMTGTHFVNTLNLIFFLDQS